MVVERTAGSNNFNMLFQSEELVDFYEQQVEVGSCVSANTNSIVEFNAVTSILSFAFRMKKRHRHLPLYPTRREMGDRRWVIAYSPNMHIDNPTVNIYGAPSTPKYFVSPSKTSIYNKNN